MFAHIPRRSIQASSMMVAAFLLFQYVSGAVTFPLGHDSQPEQTATCLCVIALSFGTLNSLVDLPYFAADPRLRVASAKGH